MTTININQAKSDLANLLDLAIEGEEIVITKDEKPLVKISPFKRGLQRGSAKGKIWISEDFDDPLEEFTE
jgi:antitoxin (DNA-binding transcriptional repressor) of toxin-antitoxin stability system